MVSTFLFVVAHLFLLPRLWAFTKHFLIQVASQVGSQVDSQLTGPQGSLVAQCDMCEGAYILDSFRLQDRKLPRELGLAGS
jgi:hypothetical protein